MAQYKTQKIASKKWVYYSGSDILLKGYILCYNNDKTTNVDGVAVAEGAGNNARYLDVEKPSTDNVKFPAGVVGQDFDGFKGPGWIQIIEFTAGEIVQVMAKVNCTNGTTVLYIDDGLYYAESTGLYMLGVVEETIDLNTDAGLILCRIGYIASSSALSDEVIKVASDLRVALNSDEKALSDATTATSNALVVQTTKIASDATASRVGWASDDVLLRTAIDSDEAIHSDAIADVSDDVFAVSNATFAVGMAIADALSDAIVILAADAKYSDAGVLASDIKQIFSDMVTKLSNAGYKG